MVLMWTDFYFGVICYNVNGKTSVKCYNGKTSVKPNTCIFVVVLGLRISLSSCPRFKKFGLKDSEDVLSITYYKVTIVYLKQID